MQLTRRLDANHDMTFGAGLANFAVNAEATQQNVSTRLMTLLGEWFLDTSAGVPYLQNICTKPADLAYAEATIKETILDTDGVSEITAFSLDYDDVSRQLTVTATITTDFGTSATIQVTQ